jgi:hypothetical protein
LRNSYGPEFGQASGSVISIITKGGSNAWHGGVSYFGRNDALNAAEYFAARTGKKDKLRRNDYGYNFSGPVVKDKLFFFWSQEWNKEIRGATRHACVPTPAEALGDFSAIPVGGTDQCGVSRPTGAAFTASETAPGSGIIANPSPAGLLLAQLLPAPNQNVTSGDNWVQSIPTKIDWREENARIDWNITSKHTLTFRYTQDSWVNPAPNAQNYWGDDPFPALEGNWDQPSKSIVGKVTSSLTNSLINDVQFSYSNNRIKVTGAGTNPGLAGQIDAALPTIYPSSQKLAGGIPTIWSGLNPYGGADLWLISPFNNAQDLFTLRDDLSKTFKNHTIKAGIYLSSNGKDEGNFGGQDRPAFGAQDWAVTTPTTNPLANILVPGMVFTGVGESNINVVDHARWHDIEFYVGDTWRARPNLTLEMGLRWSFLREPFAADDRISSWDVSAFDPALGNSPCNGLLVVPGTDPCGDFGLTGSTPGPNRALRENNNHLIAPRFGISWDPWSNGKTAIRAGVGQFFQRERISQQVGMGNNTPFGIATSVDRTLDVAPPLGGPGSVSSPSTGIDPRNVVPNSWQWNLSVEHEIARETTFQIGYVGNRGIHLTNTYDQNPVIASDRTEAAFLSGSDLNALRMAPVFGTVNRFGRDGTSSYHSLQTMFRTRIKQHLNLQAVYTWSHSIADNVLDNSSGGGNESNFTDYTDRSVDKGNSTINRPHIFVINSIINGPSFKGQNAFMQNVLGGWEFTTITNWQSGNSLTVYTQGVSSPTITDPLDPFVGHSLLNLSGTGFTQNQRPNITGVGCNSVSGGPREQIFNPAAFTITGYQIGTIGNASRGYCKGPGQINSDLAFYKNWKVKERLGIQFRLEFFNAFNHANFRGDKITGQFNLGFGQALCAGGPCSPSNNIITSPSVVSDSNFGKANLTRGPREIQYALKFTF